MKDLEPRDWGFWTLDKLEILSEYLNAFTTAGKNKSREFIYFDLFAGQTKNRERDSKKAFDGSAIIALKTGNPPFTRLRLFEKEHSQELEENLNDYEDRDVKVIPGDCNKKIFGVLKDLTEYNWAPSFAFIDPNGPDYHWTTLEALAKFRRSEKYKTELCLLFPHAMLLRLLPLKKTISPANANRITQLFGSEEWHNIYEARRGKQLQPNEAREEYINLMRWRLHKHLGYKRAHTLEFYKEDSKPLYSLIFATDHPAGDKIISHLYNKKLKQFPREIAREKREILRKKDAGEQQLFAFTEIPGKELSQSNVTYTYKEPWPPTSKRPKARPRTFPLLPSLRLLWYSFRGLAVAWL